MAYVSTWSLTMVFGYAPLGSVGCRIVTRPLFLSARMGSGHETSQYAEPLHTFLMTLMTSLCT